MHLASAAAATGARVLLIEAYLRHPTLGQRLRVRSDRGLSQLLADETQSIETVAHRVPVVGRGGEDSDYRTMDVLVADPIPPNPTDLIEPDRMSGLIRAAERQYDLVVIDTPPTSVVSDAIPLVKQVSGVIVVCRLGKTTREPAHHLRSQLANLEANTLGIVINSVGRQTGYYGPTPPARDPRASLGR
jgi:capsular exopolysaccharide synthesis family protein